MFDVDVMRPVIKDLVTISAVVIIGPALVGFTFKKIMQWFTRAFA